MKTFVGAIAVVAFALVGALMLFGEPHQKDRFVGLFTFGAKTRQCFNLYRDALNDPDTAYIGDRHLVWTLDMERRARGDNYDTKYDQWPEILHVMVRDRNSRGAYSDVVIECPLQDGRIDRTATLLHQLSRL